MDTMLRQWTMLKHIPRLPRKITATELQRILEDRGFPSTLRTVQRDLEKLGPSFQFDSDGCKPAGWAFSRESNHFQLPGMDGPSALVFQMVRLHLKPLLPETCTEYLRPYFRQADNVLTEMEIPFFSQWSHKVAVVSRGLSLQPPAIDSDVLSCVYQALLYGQQLDILYRRRGEDSPSGRRVHPLGLVMVDQNHYLVCTLWDYQDIKQVALHRISSASLRDESVRPPEGFDLQKYIAGGAFGYPVGDGKLHLKALFDPDVAVQFDESCLTPDQTLVEQEDGRVLLEAQVLDTAQLRWWLQGFGARVEVIAPESLREEFRQLSRQLLERYQGSESSHS